MRCQGPSLYLWKTFYEGFQATRPYPACTRMGESLQRLNTSHLGAPFMRPPSHITAATVSFSTNPTISSCAASELRNLRRKVCCGAKAEKGRDATVVIIGQKSPYSSILLTMVQTGDLPSRSKGQLVKDISITLGTFPCCITRW